MSRLKESWTEREFEAWFVQNPFLPGGERVVVVDRQRSLRRVVDLLCVDSRGGLLLIEVKNEASSRTAVGQSLEYLASLEGLQLDGLLDEFDGDLRLELLSAFVNPPTEITEHRRVFIVAPAFDSPSVRACRFLEDRLRTSGIEIGLMRALRSDTGEFSLEMFAGETFLRGRSLERGLAVSPLGRLYVVLVPGPRPVLWNVGRPDSRGLLRLPTGKALSRRAVRVRRTDLVPREGHPALTTALEGTTWKHRKRPSLSARVLGEVETPHGDMMVYARFRDEKFDSFRKRDGGGFRREWEQQVLDLPGWRAVASEVD